LGAGTLREDRSGEAKRTAADHRDRARTDRHRLAHGNRARAPGERPAAAAMTIVVDDELVADLLGVEPRARGAERTQADGYVEQAIEARRNGCELEWRRCGGLRRAVPEGRAAAEANSAETGQGRRLPQQTAAVECGGLHPLRGAHEIALADL